MDKMKILVVDDELDICAILKFNLEKAGFEVSTAQSAEDALEKGMNSYDLLLLDVMMEGMSGFDLAKMLKQKPQTKDIPIIFITAKDTADDAAFIMIDLDEGPQLGLQYAEDYDVTIPIYYVDGWEIEGMELEAVPLSIVIDSEGVVCGNCLGQASYDWMNDTVNDAINSAK